ncbi:hypothetical protein JCM10212_002968 [Sporobolomyces blumeae]
MTTSPPRPGPPPPPGTASAPRPHQVYIAGISGCTCSGKTTLAKHLVRIIPGSCTVFQDDFAPPSEKVPIHEVYGFQDWDDPEGAIEWDRQRDAIRHLREWGTVPEAHYSHDHLNEQVPVPISDRIEREWGAKFERLFDERQIKPRVVIAEGFLMMYDRETVRNMDARIFVREDYDTLKQRRLARAGYHTAEGSLWKDPPDYWDLCVWPAYLKAHRPFFVEGNVESGPIDPLAIEGVELIEAREVTMDEMVERTLGVIWDDLNEGRTCERFVKP